MKMRMVSSSQRESSVAVSRGLSAEKISVNNSRGDTRNGTTRNSACILAQAQEKIAQNRLSPARFSIFRLWWRDWLENRPAAETGLRLDRLLPAQ